MSRRIVGQHHLGRIRLRDDHACPDPLEDDLETAPLLLQVFDEAFARPGQRDPVECPGAQVGMGADEGDVVAVEGPSRAEDQAHRTKHATVHRERHEASGTGRLGRAILGQVIDPEGLAGRCGVAQPRVDRRRGRLQEGHQAIKLAAPPDHQRNLAGPEGREGVVAQETGNLVLAGRAHQQAGQGLELSGPRTGSLGPLPGATLLQVQLGDLD